MASQQANSLLRLIQVCLAMLGLRPDLFRQHRLVCAVSMLAWAVSTAWFLFTFKYSANPASFRTTAVIYVAVIWVVYYVGNSLVLGTGIKRWLIQRYGEERALARYNGLLAVVFANQGYAHGALFAAFAGTITLSYASGWVIAGTAVVIFGTVIKIWATFVTSVDTYYYNDMFLDRPVQACSEYVVRGPYKWFNNPMYGVGNLPAYGAAMVAFSWQVLVMAAAFQASIFGFHYLLERPFVARVYIAPTLAAAARSQAGLD